MERPVKKRYKLGVFTIAYKVCWQYFAYRPFHPTQFMALARKVTCVRKRSNYFEPHEIIESLGGEYLGWPWRLPDYLVIHYIKTGVENYYVQAGRKRLKVVVSVYRDKEYLKCETDDYSPDTLLALPICDLLKVVK